jgi:hypothetical protein
VVLRLVVGATAIAAPVLHCITDAMEWLQGGFVGMGYALVSGSARRAVLGAR